MRIENNELLKDMADRLQVTPAYLSAIENGKKKPSEIIFNKIVDLYNLSENEIDQLKIDFQHSLGSIKVDTANLSPELEDLAMIFARKISSIDKESLDEIMKI